MNPRQLSKRLLAVLITTFAVSVQASTAHLGMLAYSAAATTTQLQFSARVGMRSSSKPTESQALKQIRKQIKFLQSDFRRLKIASVRSDWSANVTNIEAAGSGLYRIHYSFSATALVNNSVQNTVEVLLPVNPETVENSERVRLCEDAHQGEGAFYYYWNPRKPGCPMVQNSDYLSFTAYFSRSANTVQTYPEYNRLFQSGQTRIVMMLGKVKSSDNDDPAVGNPWSFPVIKRTLKSLGFSTQIISTAPYIAEHLLQTPRGPVSVTVFFGETGVDKPNNSSFQRIYKNALETADVIMYGGHAGTGKNLDLDLIKNASGLSIHMPKDRYQLMLLSACFPYAYYVNDYFAAKASSQDPRGSRNLDILAEGIEGRFESIGPQMSNTLKAIVAYANGQSIMSYQELLHSHESFWKALMSVAGDEDNPTSAAGL